MGVTKHLLCVAFCASESWVTTMKWESSHGSAESSSEEWTTAAKRKGYVFSHTQQGSILTVAWVPVATKIDLVQWYSGLVARLATQICGDMFVDCLT